MKGMEDIELVIKIPEAYYELVIKRCKDPVLLNAFKNGTQLPKGHGRLIYKPTKEEIEKTIGGQSDFAECIRDSVKVVFDNAPTITEADKKERPDNICTQRCCLKNHNIGIIECDEECSNRTSF